jgi:Recombination directionality factor-like
VSVPTPIGQLDYRLPQAGRIRTGEKVWSDKFKKYLPHALDHFRLTSGDEELVAWAAKNYGGTVRPFDTQGSGDKWMVDTEATVLNVAAPVPSGITLAYELWDPHLIRRCNGEHCNVLMGTPDDAEFVPVDCICARKGALECDMKLRLSVLLGARDEDSPGPPTLGTWRWDTESDNAIKEIRGVFRALQEWVGPGLHRCKMRLEERRQPRKKYKVVVLDPGISIESLVAGDTRLVQLPTPQVPAVGELEAGASSVTPPTPHGAGEPMAGGAGEVEPAPPVGPSPASPPRDIYKTYGVAPLTPELQADAKKAQETFFPDDDIVDAEVVDDAAREWLDKLPQTHRNAALRKAREIARRHGDPEPTVAAAIPDHILQQLMEEAGDDDPRVRTPSD